MATSEAKTVCHTPTAGKAPTRIPSWKYDLLRKIILKLVPRTGDGLVAKDLAGLVASELDDDQRAQLGSVAWHTTTVKLNMEVEGELVRVAGAKPQRLLRAP